MNKITIELDQEILIDLEFHSRELHSSKNDIIKRVLYNYFQDFDVDKNFIDHEEVLKEFGI